MNIKIGWLTFVKLIIELFLFLLSICFIVNLKSLFYGTDGFGLYLSNFLLNVLDIKSYLFSYNNQVILETESYQTGLFLKERFMYSISLVTLSLIISIVTSIILGYYFFISNKIIKKTLLSVISFLRAVPIIMYFLLIQIVIIYIYKAYGIKSFELYGIFDKKIYAVPTFCLSLLPTFLLGRVLIFLINKESDENYVLFSKSIGLSNIVIFFRYLLPNIFGRLIEYLKVVYWILLSGLIVIENLLKLEGITMVLYSVYDRNTLLIVIIILNMPLLILELISRIYSRKEVG